MRTAGARPEAGSTPDASANSTASSSNRRLMRPTTAGPRLFTVRPMVAATAAGPRHHSSGVAR
ncbi:hypothetical protein [Streptomyces pinistramenti]|uniref:hypothetical protein n=1 Tax=Streptomyces pinistramenti TaxID=2884812 RepID=UPI001D09442A|nr:hypothetical protein [Streptomyces pinistramenti]MCB5912236.1 hypothetical protein [Streptomyces pinistramenti]